MQPLLISTSFSSARLRLTPRCTSLPSMLISLMSLTITATRRFSRLFRTWLSRVLLPAPRKPDSTVTGRRFMGFSQALGSVDVSARAASETSTNPGVFFALFLAFLRLDGQRRGGAQQQALQADRFAGLAAPAVFAAGQGIERMVDLVEQPLLALQHAQLPLALLFGAADVRRIAAGSCSRNTSNSSAMRACSASRWRSSRSRKNACCSAFM